MSWARCGEATAVRTAETGENAPPFAVRTAVADLKNGETFLFKA